jgi:hypothetical protein
MSKLENQNIIITSNEPWGDIWYSKQNYAHELSKTNKVYFVNPPSKWKLLNLIANPIIFSRQNENLTIISYQNPLPILNTFFDKLNNILVSKYLKMFLHKKGILNYILWAFDPIRLYNHKKLGAFFGIYHCVDFFYFTYPGERELCKNSDLILACSQRLLDEYSSFKTPKHVLPHGISSEEFELNSQQFENTDLYLKDYALYVGLVNDRINFELLEMAIKKYPLVPFVFIGPVSLSKNPFSHRIFIEKLYPNVHAIGPKHFKTLKYYVSRSRFCISFLRMDYHANTVSHHKTLIYLAQGKPVFGPEFTEYKDWGNLMYMDNTSEGLLSLLENYIENGEDTKLKEERIKFARKFTFENILNQASRIIQELPE